MAVYQTEKLLNGIYQNKKITRKELIKNAMTNINFSISFSLLTSVLL